MRLCACMHMCMCLHVSNMCSAGPEGAVSVDCYTALKQIQYIGEGGGGGGRGGGGGGQDSR